MPYHHAHWFILALLPLIGIAFWPNYYGDLRAASWAFHAHGVTATAWILLVGAQSWTIHHGRRAYHRQLGLAVYVLTPLFAAGGALALRGMAAKFQAGVHPFYSVMGARLGMHDVVSTITLVLMVRASMARRREVRLHAGYLLATVALVLPPVFARLPVPQALWHQAELLTLAVTLPLWLRAPGRNWPFVLVSGIIVLQAVLNETIARTDLWARWFVRIIDVPPLLVAVVPMAAAAAVLWPTWPRRGRGPRSNVAATV